MTPSHAPKRGKRYRYYVTRPDLIDGSPAWRVSAFDLEQLVCQRIAELLCDQQFLCQLAGNAEADAIQKAIKAGDFVAATLRSGLVHDRAALLETIVDRINLGDGGIETMTIPAPIQGSLGLSDLAIRSKSLSSSLFRLPRYDGDINCGWSFRGRRS